MTHTVNRVLAWLFMPVAGFFIRSIEPGTFDFDWEDQ